jgi:uncharacterized membrane protein
MTGGPRRTLYHRVLGWHAPSLRRAVIVMLIGLGVALALSPVASWQLAVMAGWDAAMLTFLGAVWPILHTADGERTARLAGREDPNHGTATALLAGACSASLLGVGFTLQLAGRQTGPHRALLITVVVLTVALSWITMNTVYTLRYAHLDHRPGRRAHVDFGTQQEVYRPAYHDYVYLAFTIGMTYQVSDTTLRNPVIRRAVLGHATLAYLFGVVIVAGTVTLITGLVS